MRARPVPFCFHNFLPEPATDPRTLVAAVPARRAACECRTASYSSALLISAPNTASASSTSPTFWLLKSTTSTVGMALSLRPPHHHVAAVGTGHRALPRQHIVLGIHVDHFQIAHRHLGVPHVSAHAHSRQDPGREARCANRSWRPVEHGSVRSLASTEMMPLDHAGESSPLADPLHVHHVLGLELIHQHLVAGLQIAVAAVELELADELRAFDPGLLEMPGGRLIDARRLDELEQPQLDRVVAIGGRRLALHHHARPRLEQSDRNHLPVRPENLRHPDLFAKNSWTHMQNPWESGVRSQKSE